MVALQVSRGRSERGIKSRVREGGEGKREVKRTPRGGWSASVAAKRERCRKGKTLSRRVQKAKHRKSLKRAGTFDANLCSGSSFSSGTPCRRYEDTPLRSHWPDQRPSGKGESVKEFS